MLVGPGQWPASDIPPLVEQVEVDMHWPLRPLLFLQVSLSLSLGLSKGLLMAKSSGGLSLLGLSDVCVQH